MKYKTVLIVCLIVVCQEAIGNYSEEYEDCVTVVSDNGNNIQDCINASSVTPCSSLDFVLTHINSIAFCLNCNILLLSNQSLPMNTGGSSYKIAKNITIKGSTDDVILSIGNMTVVGSSPEVNLQFYQVTIVVIDRLSMNDFNTLKFIGCIFANFHSNGFVTISGIQEELLYENVTVQNLTKLNSISQSDVHVITFRNCAFLDNSPLSLGFIYLDMFNKTVVDGCSFTNNFFNSSAMYINIGRVGSEVLIVNCRFDWNTIGNTFLIHLVKGYCQGILRIEQTSFTSNRYMASGSLNGALINQPKCLNHSIISYVNFSYNTLPLIEAVAFDSVSSHTGNISWSNLQLMYNTANKSHITVTPEFTMTILTLNNLIVIGNKIHNPSYQQATFNVIFLSNCHIYISDSQFSHNMATALGIYNSKITFNGNIKFQYNIAMNGGGMYLSNVDSISGNGTISFHKNTAQYGGAIYGGDINGSNCGLQSIQESDHEKLTIEFEDNSAGNFNGPNVYMHCNVCSSPWYDNISNYITVHGDDGSPALVSYPNKITSTDENGTVIYPGKEIVLNLIVQDCQGMDVSYLADIILEYENSRCDPDLFSLYGPSSVSLNSGTLHTGLYMQASLQPVEKENFKLLLINRDPQEQKLLHTTAVNIILTKCPPGMNFINLTCNCNVYKSDLFLCSAKLGELCIERSYWFGIKKGKTISYTQQCPYCDHSVNAQPCGIANTSKYKSVNYSNPDTQCLEGRSGTLCMYCSEEYHETYNTVNCMPHSQCKSWHKWILLLLTLLLNILIGVGLIVVIRKAFSIGVGYLYGPFFYLAALTQITPDDYGQLSKTIDGFAMVYFLQYRILGHTPLCFFNKMNRLYSIALQFVNPLMLLMIIFSFICLARSRPNISRSIFPQPVQSMSVLLLVACWSLAKTSVQILLYVRIHEQGTNSSNLRVFYHPNLEYFTHEHVPLAIISVLILSILLLHLLLMVVSQFYSFHKLKPFLDAFQSCYQDKYRWYSVVYALSVMSITLAMVFGHTSFVQCVVLFATVAQCLLQPYRKKWLNVVDTLLLLNLTAIIFLVLQDSYNKMLVSILVSMPLSYIALGTLALLIYCSGLHHRLLLRYAPLARVKDSVKMFSKATVEKMRQVNLSKSSYSSTPSHVGSLNAGQHEEDATREREPLIGILQESYRH